MVLKKVRTKEIKEATNMFYFTTKDQKFDIIEQLLDEIVNVD
jgi:hypothetical protein